MSYTWNVIQVARQNLDEANAVDPATESIVNVGLHLGRLSVHIVLPEGGTSHDAKDLLDEAITRLQGAGVSVT